MNQVYRPCRPCNGYGFIGGRQLADDHFEPDTTCRECYGVGMIRFAPFDALESVAAWRRNMLRSRSVGPSFQAMCRDHYCAARECAAKPVLLP